GSGNLGDDLMLAGFLEAARPRWLQGVALTCCTAQDAASQRLRFPEIDWLPYDEAFRAACIERADAWLGLGDTPFQATGGHTWFLDHLRQEAAWCRRHGTPMYYLGVGVNERAAADHPQTRALVAQAERLWVRDEHSAELLRPLTTPGKIVAGADLAHLALVEAEFPAPEPGTLGLVLNFEDPAQYRLEGLAALLDAAAARPTRWLAQEIRPLPGSETWLHDRLPARCRARAPLRTPDYARATSARALLQGWEGVEAMFVSRYHASLVGAWMGVKVAAFARSDKVVGAIRQLGLATVPNLDDPAAILRAVETARPVERHVLLDLTRRVRENCESFFASVSSPSVQTVTSVPAHPPARLLFLHPDTYGDLCLFEPVLRIVRDAWPQTEVAVLIRESYRDVVPLLNAAGVRWLTVACDPYRQGPGERPGALEALRDAVRAFAPDCVVAACPEQTWLESAVAAFLPAARQVCLGPGLTDPVLRAALDGVLPVDWGAIYPHRIPVGPDDHQWEQNLSLAGALLGREAPRWWPVVQVPVSARARAEEILAGAGLAAGQFVACAAAGTANVSIKGWPAEAYGETLAWLEKGHGVRALLIGHVAERAVLETVREAARRQGADPALWLGEDGEMPVVAALLDATRFYFGNDTGALHLAAALGRPLVAVFGGGTWPRFRPVAARARTVVQPLPCFGCAWDCHFVDAPCVRTISVDSVRRALQEILDGAEGSVVVEADGLDAGARALIDTATPHLRFLRTDSADRLRQTVELARQAGELSERLQTSDADRDARQDQVEELTALLATSEADRQARQDQVEELTTLLETSETDRQARQDQVEELTALLATSEADRQARQDQVEELTTLLETSE
ncbi:MAG: polysaccharide pyruvyl transferase family protein, partial [Gluconacetobacter diazotrophicus]|nr:polysaccharide pyruvyl transferase family protein [Gluconacetobacter diazotrophicus]